MNQSMIQIDEIDYDAATRIAKHGRHYPAQAPLLPEQGMLLAIDERLLAFAGQDGKKDGFVFGISEHPGAAWRTTFIEDYSKGDLYCRYIYFERARAIALPEGQGRFAVPEGAISEPFLPLVIRVVYEHDIHGHSYAPALATVTVRFSLGVEDQGFSLLEVTEDKPAFPRSLDPLKMQPGDFQPAGAVQLERFEEHLRSQFGPPLARHG